MLVKELKEMLSKIDDHKEICVIVNDGHPEDDHNDRSFDFVDIWDNSENTIDLFVGMNGETYE